MTIPTQYTTNSTDSTDSQSTTKSSTFTSFQLTTSSTSNITIYTRSAIQENKQTTKASISTNSISIIKPKTTHFILNEITTHETFQIYTIISKKNSIQNPTTNSTAKTTTISEANICTASKSIIFSTNQSILKLSIDTSMIKNSSTFKTEILTRKMIAPAYLNLNCTYWYIYALIYNLNNSRDSIQVELSNTVEENFY